MYLNFEDDYLIKHLSFNTAKEITQQPSTWIKTLNIIQSRKNKINEFISQLGRKGTYDIVFMGAGTSEYIGNTLVQYFNKNNLFNTRSVPSTDMILNPELYVNPKKKTLYISYGRSGNSPESVGSVQAVNSVTENAYHLFITCNANGALAKFAYLDDRILSIELPDETNDLGFAMTSSFTNMLLATLLCFNLNLSDKKIYSLSKSVEHSLIQHSLTIQKMVNDFDFDRIVYLGSQCMKGYAQESALKILELTQGRVSTIYDTLTGFRHGPKSFINQKTLIVIFLSDDEFTRKYELDLIQELKSQQNGYKILLINHKGIDYKTDYTIQCEYNDLIMELVGLKMIVISHMIAFYKSLSLGISVDNPCPSGEVNRVVTGVTIYLPKSL